MAARVRTPARAGQRKMLTQEGVSRSFLEGLPSCPHAEGPRGRGPSGGHSAAARHRPRTTPSYEGSDGASVWGADAVLATADAGAVTSADHDTSAGHQCQTPSVIRRVSVSGTHNPRSTSTWRFARRSGGPQRCNTPSVVMSLISCVGEAKATIGIGTTAIIELSIHSLPEQWLATEDAGWPDSLTRTSRVSAVQPASASAATISGNAAGRTCIMLRSLVIASSFRDG